MKKIIILLTVVATTLGIYSCKDDNLSNAIESADQLFLPRNNYPVDTSKDVAVKFEWKTSGTEDGSYLSYELLFDTENGDFSDPIYAVKSSNNGYSPEAEVSGAAMKTIATLAADRTAADPGSNITVKWTVRVWNGLTSTLYSGTANGVRTILATVPFPAKLSIRGSSTENQATVALSQASVLNAAKGTYSDRRENNAYECYTKLTEGEFLIKDDRGRYFYLDGSGNILASESESNPTPTAVTKEGVYRIYMNLNTMAYTMQEISKVEFLLSKSSGAMPVLTYASNGVWVLEDYAWDVRTGNSDSRHKFVCTYADNSVEYWGHFEDDCRGADKPEGEKNKLFYNIFRHSYDGKWDNTWKINESVGEGFAQNVTFQLRMNNTDAALFLYERSFTGAGERPYPVEEFIAPAADALIALNNVPNSAAQFSWSPSSQTQITTPKYEIVFFSDAAGTNEVGRYTANNSGLNTSADVSHINLDQAAERAGIEPETTGTIYWSVYTIIYSNSVIASTPPRPVQVTRLPGMPAELYITGTASEFGTGFKKLKSLGNARFEIYTKLSAGTYQFTTATTGSDIRYFTVNSSNQITEGGPGDATTVTGGDKIYRIILDFYAQKVVFDEISYVKYHFAPRTSDNENLTYVGNGVWELNKYIEFKQEGWGRDERYHFQAKIPAANHPDVTYHNGYSGVEIWGSVNNDNSSRGPGSGSTDSYNNIIVRPYNGDFWWSYCFKFNEAFDYKTVKFRVIMSPDVANYHHTVTIQ